VRRKIFGRPILKVLDVMNSQLVPVLLSVGKCCYFRHSIRVLARPQGQLPSQNQSKTENRQNPPAHSKKDRERGASNSPCDANCRSNRGRSRQIEIERPGAPCQKKESGPT
jgi:hypothetical protein